jgi:cytochrome P450
MTDWDQIDRDLTTPEFFAGTDFHVTFDVMRREDPVHWTKGLYPNGFWSLTSYADVLRLLDDPVLFSIKNGPHLPPEAIPYTDAQLRDLGFDIGIASTDPPYHMTRRAPMNPHFSVPAVAKIRDDVERIVDEIFDGVLPRGEADLVEDLAAQVPVRLFLPMMGVPKEDWAYIRGLTIQLLHPEDPEFQREGEDAVQTTIDAQVEIYDYKCGATRDRRPDPEIRGDDRGCRARRTAELGRVGQHDRFQEARHPVRIPRARRGVTNRRRVLSSQRAPPARWPARADRRSATNTTPVLCRPRAS